MKIKFIILLTVFILILTACGKNSIEEITEESETTIFIEDYSRILIRPWLESEMLNSLEFDGDNLISVLNVELGAGLAEVREKLGVSDTVSGDYETGDFSLIFHGLNFESLYVKFTNNKISYFEFRYNLETESVKESEIDENYPQWWRD
jgi:hypothetical protein